MQLSIAEDARLERIVPTIIRPAIRRRHRSTIRTHTHRRAGTRKPQLRIERTRTRRTGRSRTKDPSSESRPRRRRTTIKRRTLVLVLALLVLVLVLVLVLMRTVEPTPHKRGIKRKIHTRAWVLILHLEPLRLERRTRSNRLTLHPPRPLLPIHHHMPRRIKRPPRARVRLETSPSARHMGLVVHRVEVVVRIETRTRVGIEARAFVECGVEGTVVELGVVVFGGDAEIATVHPEWLGHVVEVEAASTEYTVE